MGYDPDPPTRRIPPQQPGGPAPGGYPRETEYVAGQSAAWQQELLDRVRSLQTWLAVIGVVAVLAVGIAIWALVKANQTDAGSSSGQGVSSARVTDLENRVDNLESDLRQRATKTSVQNVQSDVSALQDQVKQLSSQSSSNQNDQAIKDLQTSVDDLTKRVDQLESQQQGAAAGGTTTTP